MTERANITEIEDLDDPRLDDYRDIRDRELHGRDGLDGDGPPGRGGLFIGEQLLVVERMLGLPGVTRSVLIAPRWRDRVGPLAPPQVPVYVAPLTLMKRVAGFDIHRGVLAVGNRASVEREGLELPPDGPLTLLLCEEIRNIDNIGLLFRNAAAFGVDGVLLSPRCHDPLYRKSLRVSIGHALTVPFARSRDWPADLGRLRAKSVTLIAAATAPDAVDLETLSCPRRVGLLVGSEYDGLPAATLKLADHIARVPMAAGVDSLNVAVAAAVCLHRFSTGRRG